MKKNILFLVCALISLNLSSQEEIYFTSQAAIDQFIVDNPNQTVFEGSMIINDNENTPITNLDGFANIEQSIGYVMISDNPELASLSGLESLAQIGTGPTGIGGLAIEDNQILSDVSALANLINLADRELSIQNNPNLGDLSGLENLSNVGSLILRDLSTLSNLNSFQNLTNITGQPFIGGNLTLENNFALTSLVGLSNVTHINGAVRIKNNHQLENLVGLENAFVEWDNFSWFVIEDNESLNDISALQIDNVSQQGFSIKNNPKLDICDLEFICNKENIQPDEIENNGDECISLEQVYSICDMLKLYEFSSQLEIDQFLIDNPDLTSLDGGLYIADEQNTPITNLNGFINLTEVVGAIEIVGNPELENLDGLDNVYVTEVDPETSRLIRIEGNNSLTDIAALMSKFNSLPGLSLLFTANRELTKFSALSNITTLGDLTLVFMEGIENLDDLTSLSTLDGLGSSNYSLEFLANPNLKSIEGLSSLVNVNGPINIYDNDALTSLNGLENAVITGADTTYTFGIVRNELLTDISALSLEKVGSMGFSILENPNLECCSRDFLCDDLAIPSDYIAGNAEGCQSIAEVIENCGEDCGIVDNLEPTDYREIAVFSPNPAVNHINIRASQQVKIEMLDFSGKSIFQDTTDDTLQLDLAAFPEGLYFIQFSTEKASWVEKLVVQ